MIEELCKKHPMIQMRCKLKGRGLVEFVDVRSEFLMGRFTPQKGHHSILQAACVNSVMVGYWW
jgi:hypothetical protein